jgi:hypothetical protein
MKLWVRVLEQANWPLSEAKELSRQSQYAPSLSIDFGELIEIVGLGGGSCVTGGLSAPGW